MRTHRPSQALNRALALFTPTTPLPSFLILVPVILGTVLLSLGLAPALTAQPTPLLPPGAEEAAKTITPEVLASPIRFLADDLLEGRGPASRGDSLTRLYLASTLGLLGLEPGGPDGSWEQTFDIVGVDSKCPRTWTFHAGENSVDLAHWDDYIAGSLVQEEKTGIENAEVVFVGYGIEAPEYGWDDFKGTDLKGKVLLMLNNDPDWDPDLFGGEARLYYGRWTYKYESAARQGAVGAIIIHTTPSAGYPFQVVQTSWSGPQFHLPATGEPVLTVAAWTSWEATERLVTAAGHDLGALVESAKSRDFRPVPLGLTTSIALDNRIERTRTANVLGLLRGSDPKLADEVVVFTAHHDHLGKGPDEGDKDVIYNGAVDNAAGVAQLLAIARAITHLPVAPRRSILINFVAAEEQGLLGSKYYAENPTFPPGKIAANLNFDGGNIWGETRDITLIGYGKSSLDGVARAFAEAQGRRLVPDQFADKGYFYRSDQFNLAKIGVPALYFDNGTDFVGREEGWGKEQVEAWTEVHYHQPSDELTPEWVYDGMIQDARLGLYCGLAVAQADAMPAWNPGDEFEAARKAALAAAGE